MSRFSLIPVFIFSIVSFASSNAEEGIENQNATSAQVQDYFDHVFEGVCYIQTGAQEIIETSAQFVWERVPNRDEIVYDVALGALVEMGLNAVGLDLGKNNPAAKCIVRDVSKIISMIPKVYHNVEVGSTGVKFDTANVVSQIAKPLAKAAGIIYLQRMHGFDGELASEKANYLGDTLSRGIVLAGNERQKSGSTLSFWQYVEDNFNPAWVSNAVLQVIPKNIIVGIISHRIKTHRFGDRIDNSVFGVSAWMLGHSLAGSAGIIASTNLLRAKGVSLPVAFCASFGTIYASTALNQLVNTYLLSTPARVTMDMFDWAAGASKAFGQKVYDVVAKQLQSDSSQGKQDL